MAIIDQDTEFGARAAQHLRDEVVVWLTSVLPSGAPLPRPVWFLWDGEDSVLMYSMPGARVENIQANPRVTLNFGGNGKGGDIVVLSGRAAIDASVPAADQHPEYLEKYASMIEGIGMTPESFAQRYSAPVRITLTKLSGH